MKKNIMLTVFAICVILIYVGCKNGYNSVKEHENDENADKLFDVNESLIEDTTSSRRC